MVRHNCFEFFIGTSMKFGLEAKNFIAHDVQKNSSEAMQPCPADVPSGNLVGHQPKSLASPILEPSLRYRLGCRPVFRHSGI